MLLFVGSVLSAKRAKITWLEETSMGQSSVLCKQLLDSTRGRSVPYTTAIVKVWEHQCYIQGSEGRLISFVEVPV